MLFDRFSFREREEGMPDDESVADLPTESRGYSFTLDTRQMIFLIAGYCFLCVLVFALGIVVGRAIAEPEAVIDATGTQASLSPQPSTHTRPEAPPPDRISLLPGREPQSQTTSSPEFTFSPTLPGTPPTRQEEPATPTAPLSRPAIIPEGPARVEPRMEPPAVTARSEEQREVEPKRVAPAEIKPKTPPAARPVSSEGGDYTIQVSSFRSLDQASDLKGRLSKRGYSAYVQSVDLSDKGTWHRVRVGNYRDKDGAERVASDIRNRESLPAMVTRR
jgi:cell division septation protein DedD